jgi:hypothetical protein
MQSWGIDSLAALVANLQIGDVTTEDGLDVPSGNIFDGRTSQSPVRDEDGTTVTVQEYFRRHRDVVAVTTSGGDGIIFLGSRFFGESEDERTITLIHEAIHRAGLPDTDFGATKDEGSQNLSAWLRDKCLPRN